MQYWLAKQEPEDFSWVDFVKAGRTPWTGIRNYQARNNLRAMKKGDLVLFYHSGKEKSVVGIARVEKESYADPTATEGDWSCVDLAPVKPLEEPVNLATIKTDGVLQSLLLVRNTRLSVSPVGAKQFERLLKLARTAL